MRTETNSLATAALRKVELRLIPFLWLLYVAAFLDRSSVSFAGAQMNRDLGFSASVLGLGAGIFFIGYCLFEVPSNLLLHRMGGPRWLSRIMLSWGLVAGALAFVRGETGFYVLRFLLGVAEAGFFPGVIYYLTQWVPRERRARLTAAFMTAIPISTAIGGPIATAVLSLDGSWGLSGWQRLYLAETLPSLTLGLITIRYLPETPAKARWLLPEEKSRLIEMLQAEEAHGERKIKPP
jgi:ACS family tartrate transporter-like MFS transporter